MKSDQSEVAGIKPNLKETERDSMELRRDIIRKIYFVLINDFISLRPQAESEGPDQSRQKVP